MPARIHVPVSLRAGDHLVLPPGPSRHVQVLRLQPGAVLSLFNGEGGEWAATITRIGRQQVEVNIGPHEPADRELACAVTLAIGMPANDRMDDLVEKATELGVAAIQPLVCERSVLRLAGERADKKVAHWQGVAAAASEQSGRTRVPSIAPVRGCAEWLQRLAVLPPDARRASARWVLSLRSSQPFRAEPTPAGAALFLSGPEGGLTEAEEGAALACGFEPVSLGPRTLRADTAPLAALAWLALAAAPGC